MIPSDGRGELPRNPLRAVLVFALVALAVLTSSRVLLAIAHWDQVSEEDGLSRVLLGGLRIDTALVAMLAGPIAVVAPWFGGTSRAARLYRSIQTTWLTGCLMLLAFLELATPFFIAEHGLRPNRLFIEYLDSPREVGGMLLGAYRLPLAGALALMVALVFVGRRLFAPPGWAAAWKPWKSALASVALAGLVVVGARSGLAHRPINPSSVAFCDDALVNSLALNSLYSVGYEAYALRHDVDTRRFYRTMEPARIVELVLDAAGIDATGADPTAPSLHTQVPTRAARERPRNLVVIVLESLGARYVGALGGMPLTPELDALANEGWWFTRMYATGTRSARGLEAIVSGFPPSPARAALKLPKAQGGFFTLASALRAQGYHTRFVYGGEGHFDNMQGFFLANGFHEAIDRDDYADPEFVGSWGVSDEDIFGRVHGELSKAGSQPTFTLAFSVSNHSPWEFPDGRVDLVEEPKATRNNTVRYGDWALGDFFRKAKASPYFDDTLFVVVADHDSRIYGSDLVPVPYFHIPALILGAGIEPRSDDQLASQIDLGPTILSLLGIESRHPMIGHDLTRPRPGGVGRAILQYDNNHGYWSGDSIVVHQRQKPAAQFRCDGETLTPEPLDPELAKTALAHALWPGWIYHCQGYRFGSASK